jgi:hypothetical protein
MTGAFSAPGSEEQSQLTTIIDDKALAMIEIDKHLCRAESLVEENTAM